MEDVIDCGDCCLYDASVDGFANDVVSSVMMAFVVGTTNSNEEDAPPTVVSICCMISRLEVRTRLSTLATAAAAAAD